MSDERRSFSDWVWTTLPWILQAMIWIPTRIILRVFFRTHIEGVEHLKGIRGPVIFAVNHTSFWDPILVAGALPFFSRRYPMMYVAREHAYYHRYGKFFPMFLFQAWGAHPAQGGLRDYAASLATHVHFLKQGRSLCVFPEGKVSRTTEDIQPFKGGIGYLAYETKATVVPVILHGTYNMTLKGVFTRRYVATISFCRPLVFEDLFITKGGGTHFSVDDYKKTAEDIRKQMCIVFEKYKKDI
ncbi:MAG: 1-acyl-sn-glycerol-3-phosphate acyltransferase [Candidatus Yonathbacteria bacterium]|nr:1-acyl-sn-glycerol-3-phosphate acyltransferase [Candidatus Yonathbacteria bacterium]NTW47867.1 1-acyl-sn-glycerol-3-phosphate acyltransferase [Candidatus Yonathbacteria bacterium]